MADSPVVLNIPVECAQAWLEAQIEEALIQYVGLPNTEETQACINATIAQVVNQMFPLPAPKVTIENFQHYPDRLVTFTIVVGE